MITVPTCGMWLRSPIPSPLREKKGSNSSKSDDSGCGSSISVSERSLSFSSPALKDFATRFFNSISETSSSIGSLFFPGNFTKTSTENVSNRPSTTCNTRCNELPTLTPFRRESIKILPFCEEYDGVNKRKTKTISESIMQILESRRQADEQQAQGYNVNRVNGISMKSPKFDRVQNTDDVTEISGECGVSNHLPFLTDGSYFPEDRSLCETNNVFMQSKRGAWAKKFKISRLPSFEYPSRPSDGEVEEPTVDLELTYNLDSEILEVTVVRVEDVTNLRDNNNLINSFVQLSLYQRKKNQKQRTRTAKLCRDPIFNQTFRFVDVTQKWLHVECLHLQLYQRKCLKTVCLGETRVWLDDLDLESDVKATVTERFHPWY